MLYIASTLPLHADRFDVLHDLLQHCYVLFGHVQGHQGQFLGVEEFLLLQIASTFPFHANRFDVLHDLLQHCYTLHGHLQDHQDQLPGVGELYHAVHCIYFASSC